MKALVLSGGGSKGSWQAGAVRALSESLDYKGGFDIISGTSVGAINGAGLAMYPKCDFAAASYWIGKLWSEKLKIWRLKFPWYISGLWSPSLGTNKGLKRLLDAQLDPKKVRNSGVSLLLTAVNIKTGEVNRFSEEFPDLKAAVLASSSFPVAFPPQEIDGEHYTDGGVRDIAPLSPVIKAGADEIVVLATANPFIPVESKRPKNAIKMATRVLDLLTAEVLFNDIEQCREINRAAADHPGKRIISLKVCYPTKPLADALEFDRKVMRAQIQQGYEEVKASLVM